MSDKQKVFVLGNAHMHGHCIKWKQYIALAAALLHRLGGPAPSASFHPLELLLQRVQFDSQISCEYSYALLFVIYWQKRTKLTASAFAKILDARNNSGSSCSEIDRLNVQSVLVSFC